MIIIHSKNCNHNNLNIKDIFHLNIFPKMFKMRILITKIYNSNNNNNHNIFRQNNQTLIKEILCKINRLKYRQIIAKIFKNLKPNLPNKISIKINKIKVYIFKIKILKMIIFPKILIIKVLIIYNNLTHFLSNKIIIPFQILHSPNNFKIFNLIILIIIIILLQIYNNNKIKCKIKNNKM